MRSICTWGLVLFFAVTGFIGTVHAESLSVTGHIGDTILNLNGKTSPQSLITFIEADAVKGTVVSTASGEFSKEFTAQDPGVHTIYMYATDPLGVSSITTSVTALLIGFRTLTLGNLYIPPTISLSGTQFEYQSNTTVTIRGYTVPNTPVSVQISGAEGKLLLTTTDADGYYTVSLDLSPLNAGIYTVITKLITGYPDTIPESKHMTFTITKNTPGTSATPTQSPSTNVPIATITPDPISALIPIKQPTSPDSRCYFPYVRLCFYDNNKNNIIDTKSDFTSFLVQYAKNYKQNTFITLDINEDGVVDEVDLSIVLYYTSIQPYEVLSVHTTGNIPSLRGAGNSVDFMYQANDNIIMRTFSKLMLGQFAAGILCVFVFGMLIAIRKQYDK